MSLLGRREAGASSAGRRSDLEEEGEDLLLFLRVGSEEQAGVEREVELDWLPRASCLFSMACCLAVSGIVVGEVRLREEKEKVGAVDCKRSRGERKVLGERERSSPLTERAVGNEGCVLPLYELHLKR